MDGSYDIECIPNTVYTVYSIWYIINICPQPMAGDIDTNTVAAVGSPRSFQYHCIYSVYVRRGTVASSADHIWSSGHHWTLKTPSLCHHHHHHYHHHHYPLLCFSFLVKYQNPINEDIKNRVLSRKPTVDLGLSWLAAPLTHVKITFNMSNLAAVIGRQGRK